MPALALLAAIALAFAIVTTSAGAAGVAPASPRGSWPSGAAAARAGATVQPLAVLEQAHGAFAEPGYRSRRVATVRSRRPITGAETVLPVLARHTAGDGRRWLKVLLPGRPNGAAGWITSRSTRYAGTVWRLRVDLSARRVTVLREGRTVRTLGAIVGKPSTPTPRGRFFVEESVALAPGIAGSPYALALSARSEVLQEFDGGPGQIALHGLGGVGGVIGTAVSHGCIRFDARAIGWLATHIGAGTRVDVSA